MLLTLATFQPARSELKAIAWESILLRSTSLSLSAQSRASGHSHWQDGLQ